MEPKEFQEIISFAIEKEEEAASFYEDASQRAEKPHMKTAFKEMAKQEQKHKELLQGMNAEKVADREIERIPDLKISDYLVDVEYSPDMEYQDVLILAMKREEKAFKLYNGVAEKSDDPALKKLFQILAQEEAKHKLTLESEYDDYVTKGY